MNAFLWFETEYNTQHNTCFVQQVDLFKSIFTRRRSIPIKFKCNYSMLISFHLQSSGKIYDHKFYFIAPFLSIDGIQLTQFVQNSKSSKNLLSNCPNLLTHLSHFITESEKLPLFSVVCRELFRNSCDFEFFGSLRLKLRF